MFSDKNLKRADIIQHQSDIKQRNYQDSIKQTLQIENNKETWKVEQKTENYIIKKGYFFALCVFILILFSLLVYYYFQNRIN